MQRPRAVYDVPVLRGGRPAVADREPEKNLDARGLISLQQQSWGGTLRFERLQGLVVTREATLARIPLVIESSSHRYRLNVAEMLPELPEWSPIIQAARLLAAGSAVLASIEADDAALASLAVPLAAALQARQDAIEHEAREAHQKQANKALRAGRDPLPYEPPPFVDPLSRPLEIKVETIKHRRGDPLEYVDPEVHELLRIGEQRTTLAYERRDVEALLEGARQRLAASLIEQADLEEASYGLKPGHIPAMAEVGACLAALCRQGAATSIGYVRMRWPQVIGYWRAQIFEEDE